MYHTLAHIASNHFYVDYRDDTSTCLGDANSCSVAKQIAGA